MYTILSQHEYKSFFQWLKFKIIFEINKCIIFDMRKCNEINKIIKNVYNFFYD